MNISAFLRAHSAVVGSTSVGLATYLALGRPVDASIWWVLALFSFGILDPVTTSVGVRSENVEEGMPVTRRLFGPTPSFGKMTALGLGYLLVAYLLYALSASIGYRDLIPVGITIAGVHAVAANSYVILKDRYVDF